MNGPHHTKLRPGGRALHTAAPTNRTPSGSDTRLNTYSDQVKRDLKCVGGGTHTLTPHAKTGWIKLAA